MSLDLVFKRNEIGYILNQPCELKALSCIYYSVKREIHSCRIMRRTFSLTKR